MYDELVKRLREKAGAFDYYGRPDIAFDYDGRPDIACDYEQAADALDELIRKIESLESMREITQETEYAIDKHADNIISHMEELIRGLENKPRWIPATERLPETGVYVLAYSADDDYMCVEARHKFSVFQITHWMPLPVPPKEE